MFRSRLSLLAVTCVTVSAFAAAAQPQNRAQNVSLTTSVNKAPIVAVRTRPLYQVNASVDFAKRTFQSSATVTVPVAKGDSIRDAVFFLYANSDGVGGATKAKPNIIVDSIVIGAQPLKWTRNGAVLRITFAAPQAKNFAITIRSHGTVPLAPPVSEGLGGMLGGMDLGEIMGGSSATGSARKPADYGLFSKSGDILSFGSWWYPTLAVRKNGKWQDKAPGSVGDAAYAEASDFEVSFLTPRAQNVVVATSGEKAMVKQSATRTHDAHVFRASNARDFAVSMSDKYQTKSRTFILPNGKRVLVQAFTTSSHSAKTDLAIDVAGHALQIFSKRFGDYPNAQFVVAEVPLRGGAGGIEYSNMTGISSMLYSDMGKQLDDLVGSLGGNSAMLGGMIDEQKAVLASMFEMTIAHEVAHQWWAIGVGSDSQNSPWLDESLTNYASILYYEDRYGAAKAQQMSDAHLKGSYTSARMLGVPDAPVRGATSSFFGNFQYGAIVYGKGALFYGELRKLVGDEIFFVSLREYFNKFNRKLADENSLKNIFLANSPDKTSAISALYQRWTEEAHGDADLGASASGSNDSIGSLTDVLGV